MGGAREKLWRSIGTWKGAAEMHKCWEKEIFGYYCARLMGEKWHKNFWAAKRGKVWRRRRREQNYMRAWKICSCNLYQGCLTIDRVCSHKENEDSPLPNSMNSNIDSLLQHKRWISFVMEAGAQSWRLSRDIFAVSHRKRDQSDALWLITYCK